MYPFTASTDYLWLLSDKIIQGANRINWRARWYGLESINCINVFTLPGQTSEILGEWIKDSGDLSVGVDLKEQRAFCHKGKCQVVVTGSNIWLRVEVNPGWGTAQVYIDGQVPSSIPGLLTAVDIVSCAAEDHPSLPGAAHVDLLIADGLAAGDHTLELYCNNPDGQGNWFVVIGCKTLNSSAVTRNLESYIIPTADLNQPETITLINNSLEPVLNARLTFTSGEFLDNSSNPLAVVQVGTIEPTGAVDTVCIPLITGAERQGGLLKTIELYAEYQNPAGSIPYDVTAPAVPEFLGVWGSDQDFVETRYYTKTLGSHAQFEQQGDSFTLRVQREYGWGTIRVSKNPVVKTGCSIITASADITVPDADGISIGQHVVANTNFSGIPSDVTVLNINGTTVTLSAPCTASVSGCALAFLTGITTVSCFDAEGGGFFVDVPVSGCGAGAKTIRLDRVEVDAVKYISWVSAWWTETTMYTAVTQQLQIFLQLTHVPAWPVASVHLTDNRLQWNDPDLTAYDPSIPRDNRNVVQTRHEYRFPTFGVVYQAGHTQALKQFDIVVVDPMGVTRSEVAELQALGIRVLVYVSFGEEDGVLADIWDSNSAQGPWTGDGLGPGGYASYYMKGGFESGEESECKHDRQKMESVKACAQNRPEYYTDLGRCSKACGHDWRDGFLAWRDGGQCSSGHNKEGNWQRDASVACSNDTCPDYSPLHGGCPLFERSSGCYLQDYSIVTTDWPDENGIWSAYYPNVVDRGENSWYARIRDHYLPILFDTPQHYVETLTVETHVIGSGSVIGVKVSHAPMDISEGIAITKEVEGIVYTYAINLDYDLDEHLGIIKTHVSTEGLPDIVPGDAVTVDYYRRGLACDGVFMDTVDTVDVYTAEAYQAGMASLINDMKALHPTKYFCSNRGFGILDRIIASCRYVMFETFLTSYNHITGEYYKITDPDAIYWNNYLADLLIELRRNHHFDVLGLNYVPDGAAGDELRRYVYEQTWGRGWLCWTSTALLNELDTQYPVTLDSGPVTTTDWQEVESREY